MNKFIDPDLGRMVAAPEIRGCTGCAYDESGGKCSRPIHAPSCLPMSRPDRRGIIWVILQAKGMERHEDASKKAIYHR